MSYKLELQFWKFSKKIRQIAGRSEVFNENVNKLSRFFFLLLKLNAP